MKSRAERMQRITDLTERRCNDAAGVLGERTRSLHEARTQLDELQRFRQEYGMPAARGQGISVAQLQNRQHFVHRIDQAIDQLREEIQRRHQRWLQARAQWLDIRNRAAALDGVTRRYRDQEQHAQVRMEQSLLDERAQQRRHGGIYEPD